MTFAALLFAAHPTAARENHLSTPGSSKASQRPVDHSSNRSEMSQLARCYTAVLRFREAFVIPGFNGIDVEKPGHYVLVGNEFYFTPSGPAKGTQLVNETHPEDVDRLKKSLVQEVTTNFVDVLTGQIARNAEIRPPLKNRHQMQLTPLARDRREFRRGLVTIDHFGSVENVTKTVSDCIPAMKPWEKPLVEAFKKLEARKPVWEYYLEFYYHLKVVELLRVD